MFEATSEDEEVLKPIPLPTLESGSNSTPVSIPPRWLLPGPESPVFGPPFPKD